MARMPWSAQSIPEFMSLARRTVLRPATAAACLLKGGLLALVLGTAPALAQAPPSASAAGVVRITVNLVQLDAVVTDSKGRQVTNLQPDDFEVLDDGRSQKITNFSYVSLASPAAAAQPAAPAAPSVTPEIPPVPLRPQEVRRTIALVVDDLGLSFESMAYVRRALKKFVAQEMQPGDLVAIIRTSSGLGTLQQFTNDKDLLDAAIERIRWYPMGRTGVSAFALMGPDLDNVLKSGPAGSPSRFDLSGAFNSENQLWDDVFTVGTLGAIHYVIKGLRGLPGRKSVILISDGFTMLLDADRDRRVLDELRALTDLANRSSVVIYSVDARGLQVLGLRAGDVTTGRSAAQLQSALETRRHGYFDTQAGMEYLAVQTGGFLVHDMNDLAGGVERILQDQSGYYLIGFKPPADDFRSGKSGYGFHKLRVEVKVAGLHVRSRSGFYGITDEALKPTYRSSNDRLAAAIGSPFSTAGVRVNLASQFLHEPGGRKGKLILRADLHINSQDLTFSSQPGGREQISFDAAVVTFGENGSVADAKDGTFSSSLNPADYQTTLKNGVDYLIEVPVKKPGAYQLRAAVLDPSSGRVGSASQFIEVPNLRHGRLELSSIILNASGRGDKGPAVRRFQPGDRVSYGFQVYNVRLDPVTHQARLEGQIRILHDGRQVASLSPQPVSAEKRLDPKIPSMAGWLRMGCAMQPGAYILQATLTDELAGRKNSTASQWTDFEIAGPPGDCRQGESVKQ
jgi:VWFA-related protein